MSNSHVSACATSLGPRMVLAALTLCFGALPDPGRAGDNPADSVDTLPQSEPPRVTVTAPRSDEKTLDHVYIPAFVKSHAISSERVDQLGRWHSGICPETRGLQPLSNELVSQRVLAVARMVGAPTTSGARCQTNVEIQFTLQPREFVDDIARHQPALLGYTDGPREKLNTLDHPLQAWYVTGTRSHASASPSGVRLGHNPQDTSTFEVESTYGHGSLPPIQGGIDRPGDMIRGNAEGHLKAGTWSEFVNVLVVVDASKVSGYPLATIADYVAMLALTRTAQNGCGSLPSIVDLLSPDCGDRAKPQRITDADTAFLAALYKSDLTRAVQLERAEIHDRMLRQMASH